MPSQQYRFSFVSASNLRTPLPAYLILTSLANPSSLKKRRGFETTLLLYTVIPEHGYYHAVTSLPVNF